MMKKAILFLALGLVATGCVKHDEMSFSGKVVGIRSCSATYTDQNAGYIVQLETPACVGGTVISTDKKDTMQNLVVLYEPPRIMQVGTHMHGKFYIDNNYSKANGCVNWNDQNVSNLPEGVFTEVNVD
ncbi:MAG: hypothetical protein J6Y52_00745 [Bacteroidales bacterium]|nr:hypothetical protein [Bacteroidales bacterium]